MTGAAEGLIRRQGATEWFRLDKSLFHYFAGTPAVPGIRFDGPGGRPIVHRSHLPMLPRELWGKLVPSTVESIEEDYRTDAWTPRAHQLTGAAFLRAREGTLLADSCRTGKTGTALLAVDPSLGPLLIIAPLQAREVWREWIDRCFPDFAVDFLTGRQREPQPPTVDIIFVHHEVIAWRADLQHFRAGTVIVDEAHFFGNPQAASTVAMITLCGRARQRFLLTGTPVTNRPSSLYPQLAGACPGAWGSFWDFAFRHCNARPNQYGCEAKGASREEELKARLTEVMLRRTWQDVARDLPPITRTVTIAPVGRDARRRLEAAIEETIGELKVGKIGALTRYRKLTSDLKLGEARRIALDYLNLGEPVVVWTWHREVAEKLAGDLRGYYAHGGMSIGEREDWIGAWKRSRKALVLTLAVGQTAIDLSHSFHAVFAELDYTPRVMSQAEMRTYSPERPMTVDFIAADHEVDQKIVTVVREKMALAERIGVPAAESAMDVLGGAFGDAIDEGSFERLAASLGSCG